MQTERELNLARDDVSRAQIIINEKDEMIKRFILFYKKSSILVDFRFELLQTGAKEHNEQLKKEISVSACEAFEIF